MAIFSAGCIGRTSDIRDIRNKVYEQARHDLDSPAMKISVRRHSKCINYVAFLPKEKIVKENILKEAAKCNDRTVLIFELDYKYVGVVCEYQRIVDYILDKPEEFALERDYMIKYVDNSKGVKFVSLNLDKDKREMFAGSFLLVFTTILTSIIFYVGYDYLKNMPINEMNKNELTAEYNSVLKKEFARSDKIVKKVDVVKRLDEIEMLTKESKSFLRQVTFTDDEFCVAVKTKYIDSFISLLPTNVKVKDVDKSASVVQYCYEKI